MGCFDYTCSKCNGKTCYHNGGQNRSSYVVIKVPLQDGTTVYLEGYYEEYGYVTIELDNESYEFYPIQFKKYFKDWLRNTERSKKFLCHDIYTLKEERYVSEMNDDVEIEDDNEQKTMVIIGCNPKSAVTFTSDILKKCIRADKDIGLPSEEEELAAQIALLEHEKSQKDELIIQKIQQITVECRLQIRLFSL